MLGGAICGDVGVADEASGASNVNDASPLSGKHTGQGCLHAVERAIQVCGHHPTPQMDIGLQERRRTCLAGVVDEDVDRTEAQSGVVESPRNGGSFTDVCDNMLKFVVHTCHVLAAE